MTNYPTSNSLLILSFNSNGLKNRKNDLQTVLYENRIEIALISETHFTSNSTINIPGYTIFSTNRSDNLAHDGTAILVKSPLSFKPYFPFKHYRIQERAMLLTLNNIPISISAT